MLYKILEKYTKLKANSQVSFDKTNKDIESYDKEIIKNFLELYDKEVKTIHSNEERIERNLQLLYAESVNLQKNTKEACKIYDELVEYFKEAGDLFNWCTILEQEMNSLENVFIPGKNPEPPKESQEGEKKIQEEIIKEKKEKNDEDKYKDKKTSEEKESKENQENKEIKSDNNNNNQTQEKKEQNENK